MQSVRTCICCRKKSNKNDFFKVVLNKDNIIKLDLKRNLPGRGAYFCKDGCYKNLLKTKALNRAFKRNFSESVYNEILEEIK